MQIGKTLSRRSIASMSSLFGSLRSPSGKFVFLRPSGRVLRLRFVYGKCKKYILFYNGDESQGVLEQPFYEWCSLYIKNIG